MATIAAPKALTKAQIIAQLAEKNELTKKQVAAFLDFLCRPRLQRNQEK